VKAYDRDKLVELFGNDATTLAAVEREFYDTARDVTQEIAASDDAGIIARSAHRLKGASGMIGAAPLRDLSEAIERAAKANDMPMVRRLHDRLRGEVLRVADQAGLPIEPL
jgi:HPt (histidine-containing phosphotransfer) domain-containing protein